MDGLISNYNYYLAPWLWARENNLFSLAVGYKKKEMSLRFQGLAVHFFCFISFNPEHIVLSYFCV